MLNFIVTPGRAATHFIEDERNCVILNSVLEFGIPEIANEIRLEVASTSTWLQLQLCILVTYNIQEDP